MRLLPTRGNPGLHTSVSFCGAFCAIGESTDSGTAKKPGPDLAPSPHKDVQQRRVPHLRVRPDPAILLAMMA
jgi:hypothetical protein